MDIKKKDKILVSSCNKIVISLTRTERDVIVIISNCSGQPVKNETIIERIHKDPDNYKGLCMCMSRLQAKFKKSSYGDKLFRSVRNRGYYLTQYIHVET
ncbi:winged helix-turn-helix domain-containing protein [Pseudomonas petroselini]|uniref:winged helix-turn-helix domain-containing protein n=1 Tax=Pseudomonas petroselini TaxID=2899822 RepID=UPI00386B72F9